ncbi:MAG: insulinase family protein [Phycisphaerales bacterium]|nr:insulinase family protein [Phycisphaerales bacterium]
MDKPVVRQLACGMPLIVERMGGVRSAAVTWLVPAGSARDPADREGLSAMWAELLMRGAGGLDSRAQADAFDKLGWSRGTSVETFYVALSATCLGERLEAGLPLLADMVRRPRMDGAGEEAVEAARDLCLQAIESLKDDPSERVMQNVRAAHAPSPINRSHLGTEAGLAAVRPDELGRLWHDRARPRGSIFAAAGDVDPDRLASALDRLLAGWEGAAPEVAWSGTGPRGMHHEPEDTNQVHIAVMYDGPTESRPEAWMERTATAVLSGGMGARLFSEVREKRGLCYSVYASFGTDARYGRTVAYSGTTPERAQETLTVLLGELRRIGTAAGAVTPDEFQRARTGMKSKVVFSGESSGARASALARDYHKLGRPRSLDELTAAIDAVTLADLNGYLASRPFGAGGLTVATIGPAALAMPA